MNGNGSAFEISCVIEIHQIQFPSRADNVIIKIVHINFKINKIASSLMVRGGRVPRSRNSSPVTCCGAVPS